MRLKITILKVVGFRFNSFMMIVVRKFLFLIMEFFYSIFLISVAYSDDCFIV